MYEKPIFVYGLLADIIADEDVDLSLVTAAVMVAILAQVRGLRTIAP